MSTQRRMWNVIVVIGLIFVTMACALPSLASTATPTPGVSTGSQGGTGGNTSGGVGNQGGAGGGSGGAGGSGEGSGSGNSGSPTPTPTQLATINGAPYVVKQIETLGGEAISGFVCSLMQPFGVLSVTPHVTFTLNFLPQNGQQGKVSYAYSIPDAGESHDAAGTYTLSQVGTDGTMQLSMSVSDHVVFKGFDGNIPNRYKFNLVPSDSTSCAPTP